MKTRAINRRRKTQIAKLRIKAWNLFSKYIRLRDCEAYQKNGTFAPCFTCEKLTHYKDLQAGHFVPGRGNAVLFDEEGVHAQCASCNIFHYGNSSSYWENMIKKFGLNKTLEIAGKRHVIKKYTISDYEEIIVKYTDKIRKFTPVS